MMMAAKNAPEDYRWTMSRSSLFTVGGTIATPTSNVGGSPHLRVHPPAEPQRTMHDTS